MRVMVSLNLADIMTATRPTTSQDAPTDETAGPRQESQPPPNSQPITNSTEAVTRINADEIRI
jgi:hypothetical protein